MRSIVALGHELGKSVVAEGVDTWLVCERRRIEERTRPVALYAGDRLLEAPQYDLARTVGEFQVETLAGSAALGTRQPNPFFVGPRTPRLPWSEENKQLVWTLTIGGVALFGGLTALLLWKASRGPPQESGAP